MTRAVLYLRVSTDDQTVENQRPELERVAAARGWDVVEVIADQGVSGAKGRGEREGLDRLWQLVHESRVDVIMAWSIDRLGRSTGELVNLSERCEKQGVTIYTLSDGVDTSSEMGVLYFTILAGIARIERKRISERTKAGLERARSQGKKLGRPKVLPSVKSQVIRLSERGHSIAEVAVLAQVSAATVKRIRKVQREVA